MFLDIVYYPSDPEVVEEKSFNLNISENPYGVLGISIATALIIMGLIIAIAYLVKKRKAK